jgi:hypothetical protein
MMIMMNDAHGGDEDGEHEECLMATLIILIQSSSIIIIHHTRKHRYSYSAAVSTLYAPQLSLASTVCMVEC